MVPGNAGDEVRVHTGDADIVLRALSRCAERAYGSYNSRRFGGVDIEMSESELKDRPSISSQRNSVPWTA